MLSNEEIKTIIKSNPKNIDALYTNAQMYYHLKIDRIYNDGVEFDSSKAFFFQEDNLFFVSKNYIKRISRGIIAAEYFFY